MEKLSLQHARMAYGSLVPWELDEKDLRIINRHRAKRGSSTEDFQDFLSKVTKDLWKEAHE